MHHDRKYLDQLGEKEEEQVEEERSAMIYRIGSGKQWGNWKEQKDLDVKVLVEWMKRKMRWKKQHWRGKSVV